MTPLQRLESGYYNSDPVSEANPGGFGDGGHVVNFPAALQDIASVVEGIVLDVNAIGDAGENAAQAEAAAAAAAAARAAAEALLASVVIGPDGASADHLAQFDGATGKLIKGGRGIGAAAPMDVLDRQSADARYLSFNRSDAVVNSFDPVDLANRTGNAHFAMGARTNFILRSEEIDNATWVKIGGVTVTANAYLAPREATIGERLNAGSAGGGVEQVITSNTTGWSCYAVWLFSPSAQGGEQVDLVLDANGTSAQSFTKTVTLIPGWGRYFVAGNFTAAHTQKRVRTLNGAAVIGMWGAQLDIGTDVPRGYLQTTTSSGSTTAFTLMSSLDGNFVGTFSRSRALTTAREVGAALTASSAASSGTPIRMSPSLQQSARVWSGSADVTLNLYLETIPTVSGVNYEYVWRIHDGATSIFEVEGRSGTARAGGKRLLNTDDRTAITAEIAAAISALISGAPAALDTLNEIAQALADDDVAINSLISQLAGKANTSHSHAAGDITSGTFAEARIPALPISRITSLQAALDGKAAQSHTHEVGHISGLQAALDAKATLASPTFTGTPEAPTPSAGDNTTRLATTAFVRSALPVKASGAELSALADDAKFLTPKAVADAAAPIALVDAPTITVDLAAGSNFVVTLAGNRTLGAPTGAKPGATGTILIKQPSTGGPRTLAYAAAWAPFGPTPGLSTTAGAVDLLSFVVEAPNKIRFTLAKGGAA